MVEVIKKAIVYATVLASLVFVMIVLFANQIAAVFTNEPEVVSTTAEVLTWVFLSTPIIGIQLIGSAYFQAIGKAIPALLLTLTRQGFFFIPLLLVLPRYWGTFGVWISFPIAEAVATVVTAIFLQRELRKIYRYSLECLLSFFVFLTEQLILYQGGRLLQLHQIFTLNLCDYLVLQACFICLVFYLSY